MLLILSSTAISVRPFFLCCLEQIICEKTKTAPLYYYAKFNKIGQNDDNRYDKCVYICANVK